MYKVKIDNKEIKIKDGFTITEEMNETLDSGTIQFVSEGGEQDIEPFDTVVFEKINGFSRKKLLVDAYQSEIESFNNDDIKKSDFSYQVNLFSETKILERITLPNLAITKRANGYARTVWEVIFDYCRRYLPLVKIYDESVSGRYAYQRCLKYDKSMETKFNMECPEFVWNTPTLKEVLLDLMSVANCIPVVKDNVLTYFDLTQKGNEIDTRKLTNMQTSGTSADYCDSITLPMKNVISKQPIIVNELLLPHSTSGEMTSNNACFITKKPIYKIKRAVLYVYGDDIAKAHGELHKEYLVSGDITERIYEKEKYELLSNKYKLESMNQIIENKCANLFYSRGDNKIQGIGLVIDRKTTQTVGVKKYPVYAYMAATLLPNTPTFVACTDNIENFSNATAYDFVLLQLEYETYDENTVSISREDNIKNKQNAIFDVQSANAVDLSHQTIFEYAKINRLSNKIVTIYGEYENEADIPQLSDYIGEKILFHKEVSCYDGIYLFMGMLCDNYILRDYFVGINSKERSWKIVNTNDAILRDDIYKFFVNITTKEGNNDTNSRLGQTPQYKSDSEYFFHTMLCDFTDFLNPKVVSKNSGIYSSCISTKDSQNNAYPAETSKKCITDCILFTGEKNISLFVKANDNYSFGDKIQYDDDQPIMIATPYTDNNGEMVQETIHLQPSVDVLDLNLLSFDDDFIPLLHPSTFNYNKYVEILTLYRQVPSVYAHESLDLSTNIIANFTKDNREILSSTIQFEYVTDDNENVIVNDGFAKIMLAGDGDLNPQIAQGDWTNNIGFKAVANHHYKKGDTEPLGTERTIYFITRKSAVETEYEIGGTDLGENGAWCIYSKITGKILLAVNGHKKVYLHLHHTRDFNIYNNLLDRKAIGTINDNNSTLDTAYEENPQEVHSIKVLGRVVDEDDMDWFD